MRRLVLLSVLLAAASASAGSVSRTDDRRISDLFDRVRPAVVRVTGLWPGRKALPSSGVYVGDAGIVLSWGHYAQVGWKATLVIPGGEERQGKVIAKDAQSGVVAIAATGKVPAYVRAVGEDLAAGRTTISAGHAFGTERADHWSAAGLGTVAQYRPTDDAGTQGRYLLTLAVNPGEPGGPLLAGDGRLAGILLPVRDLRSGFNQAVPVSDLRRRFAGNARVAAALAPVEATLPGDARAWPVHAALSLAAHRVSASVLSLLIRLEAAKNGVRPTDRIASGLLIDAQGHVLTAAVNLNRAEEVIVVLPGGKEARAETVATDERYDLALLKVSAEGLPAPATLAVAPPRVGQWVAAVGNPNGRAAGRGPLLSFGIVGALGRPDRRYRAIHTDAAINRANAGGALVDLDGLVIGIPSTLGGRAMSVFGANSGLGFAIPAATVTKRLESLKAGETLKHVPGYLGVSLDHENQAKDGVRITEIVPGLAAEKAGLMVDDVIQEIEGIPVHDLSDIPWIFGGLEEGQRVTVTVRRGKELLDLQAELGRRR